MLSFEHKYHTNFEIQQMKNYENQAVHRLCSNWYEIRSKREKKNAISVKVNFVHFGTHKYIYTHANTDTDTYTNNDKRNMLNK